MFLLSDIVSFLYAYQISTSSRSYSIQKSLPTRRLIYSSTFSVVTTNGYCACGYTVKNTRFSTHGDVLVWDSHPFPSSLCKHHYYIGFYNKKQVSYQKHRLLVENLFLFFILFYLFQYYGVYLVYKRLELTKR